ncbi:MAG TPA: M1 family metallopeptidase [Gemmatimonadales bacterium]|nr:M1 family metallopeptidase [Gemmatimonadales bacterium]
MLALLLLLIAAQDSTYWQQRVAYDITASLDEPSGVLTGKARIHYVNQSPDTLRDFYVHQYLNAFRPGSRWAATDSAEGRVRFQHMQDPDYAFERITSATVMGVAGKPDYPYAPDSTIAHWRLTRPLAPGDSLVADIDWQARPSTLPRRQGRQGRRFDFAQWYPKVVVYDKYGWEDHPLYPAGEFYGEFARYDVVLNVAADQVIGATGVPIEGDPGWERANANPGTPVEYQRNWYRLSGIGRVPDSRYPIADSSCGSPGRKCVRFYADSVHHFALSLNPQYRYEQGRFKNVVVRVLYQPGDSATWGKGIAVQRTETALAWLDTLYGKFAWPQITNVHRIEGGGTEFPMMIMDGSASQGLIVHELGHNYTMGILANNEWREGWIDEGFTSFQSDWFVEATGGQSGYADIEPWMLEWDIDRWSQPVSMVSNEFRDFNTYNTMIYTKGELFLEQLRYVVGDETMLKILRTYYARWRLKHVDETALREVAEEVSKTDLKWLFAQWLHGTPLIDYRIKEVKRKQTTDNRWRTTVVIDRLGDGFMPVEIGDKDAIYARASGQPQQERVEFVSAKKPGRLVLDPRLRAHDYNATNNLEPHGFFKSRTKTVTHFDNPTKNESRRDGIVQQLLPLAWYNDFGGWNGAIRSRSNYLGRFNKNLSLLSYAFGSPPDAPGPETKYRIGIYAKFGNPIDHPMPRTESSIAGWWVEGRSGVALHADRALNERQGTNTDKHAGFDAIWMAVSELGYVDRTLWDNAGTVEFEPWASVVKRSGAGNNQVWRGRLGARLGLLYRNPGAGISTNSRYDVEVFARPTGEVSVRMPFIFKTTFGARAFAGGYIAQNAPPLQRRVMVSGADPYETFTNPLLRSRGALFVRPDFHYHAPGDANLRGFRPDLGGRWAVALNLEGTKSIFRRRQGFLRDVSLEAFADAGVVDSQAVPSATSSSYTTLYDGGVGIITGHRINDLSWTMRFEMPLVVNRWDYAADIHEAATDGRLHFRWQISLEPSF